MKKAMRYINLWINHLMKSTRTLEIGFFGKTKLERGFLIKDRLYKFVYYDLGKKKDELIRKLSIKYMLPLNSGIRFEPSAELIEKKLAPIGNPRRRYQVPVEVIKKGNKVCLSLLEGEKITGRVLIPGRYDIVMAVSDSVWIWIFKHAVVEATVVESHDNFDPEMLEDESIKKFLRKRKMLDIEFIPLLLDLINSRDEKVRQRAEKKLEEIPLGKTVLDILERDAPFNGEVVKVSLGKIKRTDVQKVRQYSLKGYQRVKKKYQANGKAPKPVILKRIEDGMYFLVDGNKTCKVAEELGYDKIDACVVE